MSTPQDNGSSSGRSPRVELLEARLKSELNDLAHRMERIAEQNREMISILRRREEERERERARHDGGLNAGSLQDMIRPALWIGGILAGLYLALSGNIAP